MAQYKFVKQFGNRQAGSEHSLPGSVAFMLLNKGIIVPVEAEKKEVKPKPKAKKKK